MIISIIVKIIIGWLLLQYVPVWLKLKGTIAMIIKVVGVLVIFSALLALV